MANIYNSAASKLDQFMEGALDDTVKSEIRKKALVGGLCMAIPFFGVETFIYVFVLWSTYSKISDISGVPFKENIGKNILSGFVINVIVTAILGALLDLIPVGGWLASFALGYLSLQMSGTGYVKALKVAHGKKAKLDVNVSRGWETMKNGNVSSQAVTNRQKAEAFAEHTNTAVESARSGNYEDAIDSFSNARAVYSSEPEEADVVEAPDAQLSLTSSPQNSKPELLRELKNLLDEGILTEEEFNEEKKKILSQP